MSLLAGHRLTTELTSKLVPLIAPWHGPCRKHRFQQFLYCCVQTHCHGILSVSPSLPSNESTHYNIKQWSANWIWIKIHLELITLHTGQTNVFLTSSWSTSSLARQDTWYTRWQLVQQITSPPAWHSNQYQSWSSFTSCNPDLHVMIYKTKSHLLAYAKCLRTGRWGQYKREQVTGGRRTLHCEKVAS
jgi:hypothetical protein